MTRLVAVVGSPTAGGRTRTAIDVCLAAARDFDETAEGTVHELAATRLNGGVNDIKPIVDALLAADGILIGTPIYRGSFTGLLKSFLDAVPTEAIQGKPVALIGTGATTHHYLALDRDLRGVLAWFNAVVLPGAAYLIPGDFGDDTVSDDQSNESLAQLGRLLSDFAVRLRGAPPPPPTLQDRSGRKARGIL
jgi:NAD(P)H-dependent FMN reductase